jgi:betaine reductase
LADASSLGPYGEILPEVEFLGLLRLADEFNLVHLTPTFARETATRLGHHALWGSADLARLEKTGGINAVGEGTNSPDTVPLHRGDGSLVGSITAGYPGDSSQTPDILLENLACKASGAMAVKQLLHTSGLEPAVVDYAIGCGEEAVGDRYQRGGGSMAKAIAEMAGCVNATGSDVKAFCSAPIHALVVAGALVQAGVYEHVVVAGGGSLAKLGMKFQAHLAHEYPILEDCLAGIAVLIGPPNPQRPRLRLDVVGHHPVQAGGSAQQIYEALVVAPLDRAGLRIPEVDRYAVELHNPEITVGSADVPRTNYRTIAALAVRRGELQREDLDGFEQGHGLPGFCPTQGHIPAALPYLPHALDRMLAGSEQRALFIAKGSLFLGKMTNLSDGMSVMVEAPT